MDVMKTKICHCSQCTWARRGVRKRNRVQTKQVRAGRHKVKQTLKVGLLDPTNLDTIADNLQTVVCGDYYA